MRLTFTKRDGKYDELAIKRPDRPMEKISCPNQGIIPHDMVHYAVESTLAHGGFFSLVADGSSASFATTGGEAELAIERLVECLQAEMWGGRISAEALLLTYSDACAAHGHSPVQVSVADVESIRARLDDLTARWAAVPLNDSLVVEL